MYVWPITRLPLRFDSFPEATHEITYPLSPRSV
jgi:hypothetical protein